MKKIILSLALVGAALVAGDFAGMKKCACGSETEDQMQTCMQKNRDSNFAEFKACVAKAEKPEDMKECKKDMNSGMKGNQGQGMQGKRPEGQKPGRPEMQGLSIIPLN